MCAQCVGVMQLLNPLNLTLTDVDTSVNEEPENLSLKPEDRHAAAEKERRRLRALLEAPVRVASASPPPAHQPVKSWTPPLHPSALYGAEIKLTHPLEPLNLNNQQRSATGSISVSVPYPHQYAPYLPFNFPYGSCWPRDSHPAASSSPTGSLYPVTPLHPHGRIQSASPRGEQLSPFAPCDSLQSTPHLSPSSGKWMDAESSTKLSDAGSDIEDLSSASLSPGASSHHSDSGAETNTSHSKIKASAVRKKTSTASAARYQCQDCHKSYSTYCGLTKHQELHCVSQQAKKSFSCKHCDKVYVSLGALKMHIRTHTLPCKCMLCGKAFSRPWLLQGHIRTHTGEKPFSCQHCSRSFADRSNLRAHLQTHSDVKRYSCKACGKTFSRMSLLTKHEDGGCPGMLVKRDVA